MPRSRLLVQVFLEEVARIELASPPRGSRCRRTLAPRHELDGLIGDAEAVNEIDVDMIDAKRHGPGVRHHIVVRRMPPLRIQDLADGAQRDRQPVAQRIWVVIGPHRLGGRLSRQRAAPACDQHLEQVPRLARLPRRERHWLASVQDRQPPERDHGYLVRAPISRAVALERFLERDGTGQASELRVHIATSTRPPAARRFHLAGSR